MKALLLALAIAAPAAASAQEQIAPGLNDYPTEARADFVFGCMAANGQGRDVLARCACSIDRIASILPYEDYVSAETVLALQQGSGERMSIFKSASMAQTIVADLRRAQAEAEIICF